MTPMRSRAAIAALIAALAIATPAAAQDAEGTEAMQDAPLDAAASDPRVMGWMEGLPPPEDRVIRYSDPDFFSFPKLRWVVCHFRELMPTVAVPRGPEGYRPLERAIDERIGGVTFTPLGGDETMTWDEAFDANYTDGVIVLHEGRVVFERYSSCLDERGLHGAMSVTKSLTGLLAEALVAEGALDEGALVRTIVPELEGSAFGDATVRQVMDMTTGLSYSEDYADPEADVWRYGAASSTLPKPEGYDGPRGYFEFLTTVEPEGEHGEAFGYKTPNADALGWIVARTTGRSDLRTPLGAHLDAASAPSARPTTRWTGSARPSPVGASTRPWATWPVSASSCSTRAGWVSEQVVPAEAVSEHPPRAATRSRLRGGGLRPPRRLELPRHVVGHRPRRLRRPRGPRPDDLRRPRGGDGDRPLRLAPRGRQRRQRPHLAARLPRGGRAPEEAGQRSGGALTDPSPAQRAARRAGRAPPRPARAFGPRTRPRPNGLRGRASEIPMRPSRRRGAAPAGDGGCPCARPRRRRPASRAW